MVSQIESGRLTPSLHTLGKLAGALGVSIASLFEPAPQRPAAREPEEPTTRSSPSTAPSEKWHVLGAGLFQGKIRAVVSTLGPRGKGVKTDKVILEPGQMKLFYVIEGKVALHYNGESHTPRGRRQRLPRRRHAARLGERGPKAAKVLWVILG